jgi:DNA-directed RNA polymerase subunit F
MAVVFTSTIKIDDTGKWYIELSDVTDEENQESVVCFDMDEYETKIEEMGAEYGGHIDEVRWLKDENVPPFVLDEIRVIMAERRQKLEEEIGEPITPVTDKL